MLNPGFLQTAYPNDEERRAARVLLKLIAASLATYLLVLVLYGSDSRMALLFLAGSACLLAALGLLARGRRRAAGLLFAQSVLATVTVAATLGQGIHDTSILAYPALVVLASLIMRRGDFLLFSLLTLGALGWLVFGEASGLFVSAPYQTPNEVDFMVVAAIVLVAIASADSLAQNMRESLRLARQEIAQRKTLEARLVHQSTHDALTGLHNRAHFEQELARLEGSGEFPVSLIIADMDDLKAANDTQGHAAGDDLLRRAAAILRAVFRAGDVLARVGGDEFAVLLPRTDQATVEHMLSRVRAKQAEQNAAFPDLPVRLSLGASTAAEGTLAEAFAVADQRMYADKAIGKLQGNHAPPA